MSEKQLNLLILIAINLIQIIIALGVHQGIFSAQEYVQKLMILARLMILRAIPVKNVMLDMF